MLLLNLQENPPGNDRTLRLCIHRILRRAVTRPRRPHDPEWSSEENEEPDLPRYPDLRGWWREPRSIAFCLIGSGRLGYGYRNAAEQIVGMIAAWYNHPTKGAARRRQIVHVYLMVPQSGPMHQRRLIRKAWEQAWE